MTRLIEAATNGMHRMLLILLYATGMRRTEATLLKVSDIDSQRMVIHIRRGKGMRDRDVPLTPKLLEALRDYLALEEASRLSVPQQGEHSRHRAAYLRQDGVERLPGGRGPGRHP